MKKKQIYEIGEMLSQIDALWLNEVGVSGYTAVELFLSEYI
jgi:hypothetical protein